MHLDPAERETPPASLRPARDAAAFADALAAPVAPVPQAGRFVSTKWALVAAGLDAVLLLSAGVFSAAATGAAAADARVVVPLVVLAAVAAVRLLTRGVSGMRPSRMDRLDMIREIVTALALGLVGGLAATSLAGADTDEAVRTLALYAATAAAAMTTGRLVLSAAQRRSHIRRGNGVRTLIIGAGAIGSQLERRMLSYPGLGLLPVGFLDDHPIAPPRVARRSPVLGSPADLEAIVERTRAEHVIVAFSSTPDSDVLPLVSRCQRLGVDVSLVPRLFEAINDRGRTEQLGPLPLVRLCNTDPSSAPFMVKHLLSRTIACVAIVLASPVFLAVALAIKLTSPGPVLFRQARAGRDGHVFEMFKFRSMRVGGEARSDSAALLHIERGAGPGGVEGEDRRTTVGRFLRRTALDELPQLFNVARGDMDLVGPRPERPDLIAVLEPTVRRYEDRHRVKAGMTGWAQINGLRGQTSLEERIEWDNWYINNWSLWLDLKILIWTPLAVLRTPVD